MQFKFHLGTKVYFGRDCVNENKSELGKFGSRAFIVTGKTSGRASGALDEVLEVLNQLNISYMIYDGVENNPGLENVKEGGTKAAEFKADFVIGIGGGSPLDAAKAVAVLAVNQIDPLDLYKNIFPQKPLPIVAIPTTAGTGSEVTPYSILTRDDMKTKMSFGNEDTFPKIALLDPKFTESMGYDTTVNTAVDAVSHALEGYLGKRSTPASDLFAEEAIGIFGSTVKALCENRMDYELREKLLYMSMLGGMVISHTGTTIIHGLGYCLTYYKDVPHGRANGIFMKDYLSFNYEYAKSKINHVLSLMNLGSIEEFGLVMNKLIPEKIKVTKEELNIYASTTMKQRSTSSNIRQVSEEDLINILKSSLVVE